MTKFEEEVKRPANGPLTELNNNMQEVFSQYRKMRQYADYLEYDSKQKDERIQDFKNALNEASNELSRLSYENDSLKSQLQQQALPVVPECVAEYIEECKKEGDCLFGIFADATRVEHDMPDLVYFWLGDEGNNDELFARAWLDGYTVEKPQLFYLKNKLTGLNLVLEQSFNATGKHVGERFREFDMQYIATDEQEARLYKNTFSKAEIDSMQTGCYEQIEVTE